MILVLYKECVHCINLIKVELNVNISSAQCYVFLNLWDNVVHGCSGYSLINRPYQPVVPRENLVHRIGPQGTPRMAHKQVQLIAIIISTRRLP